MRVEESGGGLASRVILVGGWIYLYDHQPQIRIGNTDLILSADGSKLIAQALFWENGVFRIIRAYLRNGAGSTAQFTRTTGGQSSPMNVGQYVDANFDKTGVFLSFSSPATFDENAPPSGSAGLMAEIDTERNLRNIP
jgi:hypothetical protein